MTPDATALIVQLRDDVARYHATVERHIARCEACGARVDKLDTTIFGNPQEADAIGLLREVDSLKLSRTYMRRGFQAVWGLAAVGAGAALKCLF